MDKDRHVDSVEWRSERERERGRDEKVRTQIGRKKYV